MASLPEPTRSLSKLLILTGLRVGELLALRWGNVDLETRQLLVTESVYEGHFDDPKTRRSLRRIPIGSETARLLAGRKPTQVKPNELVFASRSGGPLNRRNLLRRHLQPTCRRLGLPEMTWHLLRHHHASFLDAVGAPLGTVQAQLGHATAEITRRIYIHAISDKQRRAVEAVERLVLDPNGLKLQRPTTEDLR